MVHVAGVEMIVTQARLSLIPQKMVSALYRSKNIYKVCLENCLSYCLLSDSSEADATWKSSLVKIQIWRIGP